MSNLTDNEIEMALEYCTNPKAGKECPRAKFVDVCNDGCINILMRQAYELTNRQKAEIKSLTEKLEALGDPLQDAHYKIAEQQAEIERLKKKNEELAEILSDTIRIRYAECKADAIKEFAERLKNLTASYWLDNINKGHIDNLVKEMVGDGK